MDCLFCQIITGEVSSYKVYEDEHSMAILDIFPVSPGHTLVLAKKHFETLSDMDEETAGAVFKTVVKIHKALKLLTPNSNGINILQNNGSGAGQEIPHVHFHIIPRFKNDYVKFKFPKCNLGDAQMKFLLNKLVTGINEQATH
jgi:histidine triad (HIT) family protein